MKHVHISTEASKMQTKKLGFGIAYASLALATGFIALPAMISSALAGPSDADRKAMIHIDPILASPLGLMTDSIESASANSALIDHSELKATYAGVQLESYDDLKTVFALDNVDDSVTASIHDVKTVIYILSKASALKHQLIAEAEADEYSDDAIFVLAQGSSAEIIVGQFDIGTSLNKKLVAGYFHSDIFDTDEIVASRIDPSAAAKQNGADHSVAT